MISFLVLTGDRDNRGREGGGGSVSNSVWEISKGSAGRSPVPVATTVGAVTFFPVRAARLKASEVQFSQASVMVELVLSLIVVWHVVIHNIAQCLLDALFRVLMCVSVCVNVCVLGCVVVCICKGQKVGGT